MTTAAARGVRDNANTPPRVTVVMPDDIPGLMTATGADDTRAGQLLSPVLRLATHIRSKQGRGSTCPCCRGEISGPFATVLIKVGNAEPSLAAAVCIDGARLSLVDDVSLHCQHAETLWNASGGNLRRPSHFVRSWLESFGSQNRHGRWPFEKLNEGLSDFR